jgi:DNA-binding transcriptional MerR regulator
MDAAEQKERSLRIGEIAKALGTTTKALRHYERMEILRPPQRTEKGYRIYDQNDLRRARQVVNLRRIGLSIEQIHDLLKHTPGGATRRQLLLGLLDEKLRDTDEMLGVLQGRRDDLAARYIALLDTPRERVGTCICDALILPCECRDGPDRPGE